MTINLFDIEDCDDSGAMAHVVEKTPTRGHRMRKIIDIRERIATRAYFAWQNGSTVGADENWIGAEAIELAYAERRATVARKAAETRKAKSPNATVQKKVTSGYRKDETVVVSTP